MSDEKDFYSFEEALDELRLKEEELKRLVSEGEIRAFRKGDTMKLRRADVESLRAELTGGDVVDLGDVGEDLVFEDDTELDDAGMATQEIADVETIIEDDDIEDVGEIDLEDDDTLEEEFEEERAPRRPAVAAAAAVEEEDHEGPLELALAIATSLVLVAAMPLALSISTGTISGLARSLAGIFVSME